MSATRSSLAVAPEIGLFLGRQSELTRLEEAMRKRESLVIWGASGSGKSLLVARAIAQMPERVARRCVCASGAGSPQEILRRIAQGLAEDPLFRAKFRADTGYGASFSQWVKAQTSLRLRGLLYRAAGAGEYWIFLEDLAPMTHMLARIVKELILNQSTPVYAITPGWTYTELGYAASLYWNDKLRLHVGGLSLAAARELLEFSIRQFGLSEFDLEGFREDILDFSGMLPGAIVRMCGAAADSHYHFEGRIKTKLLHVDYLVNHCQHRIDEKSANRGTQRATGR
jgi:AAA domain